MTGCLGEYGSGGPSRLVAQPEIMVGGGGISNLMKLHLTDRKPKDQEMCRFDSARYPEPQTSGLRQRLSVAFLHDLPFHLPVDERLDPRAGSHKGPWCCV